MDVEGLDVEVLEAAFKSEKFLVITKESLLNELRSILHDIVLELALFVFAKFKN